VRGAAAAAPGQALARGPRGGLTSMAFQATCPCRNRKRLAYRAMRREPDGPSEVAALRRHKLELQEEKKRLKARISRIDVESRRNIRAVVNPGMITRLDREYASLRDELEQNKRELEDLRMSDSAALRAELQEEIKVVYLERVRLQEVQAAQEQELEAVRGEYEALQGEEGPAARERRARRLEGYRGKLEKYKHANRKIVARIKTMRANRAFDNDKGREQIRVRADELRREIETAQAEADAAQDEIEAARRSHRTEMRLARARAGSRGPRT